MKMMGGRSKIPVCEPSIGKREKRWVNKALSENRLSASAGFVEKFEKEFAKKIGTKYAVAVNSGGSSLFLALKALGIGAGDEVIIPDYTYISCVNAVIHCGAKPILVDARWEDNNIDYRLIEKKITKRTRAIMPAHLYGNPCNMKEIMNIVGKYWSIDTLHNIFVVEDCSEAHGATYNGKAVGSMGDCGCFSLYANKIITTGEGGIITTNNWELAQELRRLRDDYFITKGIYRHNKPAWNMRMSSLEAAIGLGQLERWNELIEKRMDIAQYYEDILSDWADTHIDNACWMYFLKTPHRDELEKRLEFLNIETRRAFIPIHKQKFIKTKEEYPISNKIEKEGIYLPTGSHLKKHEVRLIATETRNFLRKKREN
jgi:perosamine synthetase